MIQLEASPPPRKNLRFHRHEIKIEIKRSENLARTQAPFVTRYEDILMDPIDLTLPESKIPLMKSCHNSLPNATRHRRFKKHTHTRGLSRPASSLVLIRFALVYILIKLIRKLGRFLPQIVMITRKTRVVLSHSRRVPTINPPTKSTFSTVK